jgi:biopolymer transport protein ExbD
MAEIQGGDSGGGKHQKKGKGRKKGGNPRVDMTPMVDLAFLLLTFFVLTSNLNKMKTTEITMPKDVEDTTHQMNVNNDLAVTLLLDGNKAGKIYYYEGALSPTSTLFDVTLDPKTGLRKYAMGRNAPIVNDMKVLRANFKKGGITDSAFKVQKNAISEKHKKEAPFFIVKWGGAATYNDVINVIDELKICDVGQYALVKISTVELQALSSKTGIHYPELDVPDPAAPAAGQPK